MSPTVNTIPAYISWHSNPRCANAANVARLEAHLAEEGRQRLEAEQLNRRLHRELEDERRRRIEAENEVELLYRILRAPCDIVLHVSCA